ncbi:MAG TPA: hypothetical protein VNP91_08800 [Methylomirabilota bacterium]|jgi:hypothetical protein|nr:hypothetical protein [Methylomirabilota bacterium]
MRAPALLALVLSLFACLISTGPAGAAEPRDRLERFRELAARPLALVEETGGRLDAEVQDEIEALLDAEVLESLRSGGPFASLEFIRDRLEAFADAWGGASLRITPAGAGFLVGRFMLSAKGVGNSIRLYGRSDGVPALIEVWREDGVPEVFPWSSPRAGDTAGFLAAWSESPTGWGSRPLRLTLWRVRGRTPSATWQSAALYPDGLWASQLAVKGGTVFIHYELRYPGWKPGCDAQSEQEDTYRVEPATGSLTLVKRQLFNGWHRELQAAVTRLFAALEKRDTRGLTGLVPAAGVRKKLPAGLAAETACDVQNPDTPRVAQVAASAPGENGRRVAWTLWWGRSESGWRLSDAAPVLR